MKKQTHQHNKQHKDTQPIKKGKDIATHPDPKIDQDFPGYPHAPAQEKSIHPQSKTDEKNAGIREADSDGSANAFEGTEENDVLRSELDNDRDDSKEAY